jgi:hypothetical protein
MKLRMYHHCPDLILSGFAWMIIRDLVAFWRRGCAILAQNEEPANPGGIDYLVYAAPQRVWQVELIAALGGVIVFLALSSLQKRTRPVTLVIAMLGTFLISGIFRILAFLITRWANFNGKLLSDDLISSDLFATILLVCELFVVWSLSKSFWKESRTRGGER